MSDPGEDRPSDREDGQQNPEPAGSQPVGETDLGDEPDPEWARYTPDSAGGQPAYAEPTDGPVPYPRNTWYRYATPDEATEAEEEEPVPWQRRMVHSIPYYVVVLGTPAALAWWPAMATNAPFYKWLAGILTGFAVVVVILRFVRGSLMEARNKLKEDLEEIKALIEEGSRGIKPSSALGEQLFRGEQLYWETKHHPLSIVLKLIGRLRKAFGKKKTWRRRFAVFMAVTAAVLWTMLFSANAGWAIAAAIAAPVAYLLFNIGEWHADRYAITDQRIMAMIGLVGSDIPWMPHARVTDVKVRRSKTARILGWLRITKYVIGTFIVESAGDDQALRELPMIPGADAVAAGLEFGKIK